MTLAEPVSNWATLDLDTISRTREVVLSSRRTDGTLTHGTTIWTVVVDGSVYTRSSDGPEKPWYRRALTRGRGRLEAGGRTFDVVFTDAAGTGRTPIDAEYRRKYHRSPRYNINRAATSVATLQLSPDPNQSV
ncbi:MAG: uncharacterized protein JWQ43_3613 [Glaciihabitans sp.]|nr:uncharacterized protein [Glaciihabitans sp.]